MVFSFEFLLLRSNSLMNLYDWIKNCIFLDMPVPKFLQGNILLHQLVEQYFDLSAIPRKYVFFVLAQSSENKLEKEKCIEFCSPSGSEEFLNYCNRPKRSILEVVLFKTYIESFVIFTENKTAFFIF